MTDRPVSVYNEIVNGWKLSGSELVVMYADVETKVETEGRGNRMTNRALFWAFFSLARYPTGKGKGEGSWKQE